ncbi:MAG: protein kinase [Myxococcota bacterium]
MRPLADVGEACEEAAVGLMAFLGLAASEGPPPQLDELAASGRALLHADRGELFDAWREVDGKLSPTAVAVRQDIEARASNSDAPVSERARVLAAAGRTGPAWTLVERRVKRTLREQRPDPRLLLAAAEIELARSNPRNARRYALQLVESEAANADVQRVYAHILVEQNDERGARRALRQVVQLDPEDSKSYELLAALETSDRKARAEWLLRAGRRESRRLNPDRAERLLDRAAREEPSVALASWRSRGEFELALGRPAESLTAWRKVVEVDGDDAIAYREMGNAMRLLGDSDSAVAAYQKALSLKPNDPGALHGLGAARLARAEPAEAVPLLQRSLEAEPRDSSKRQNLAQALRATGNLEKALAVLEDSKTRSADNRRLSAQIHTELGNHEAARDALVEATRLDPFDPGLHEQLADAYASVGDAESAARAREFTALLRGRAPVVDEDLLDLVAGTENAEGGPAFDRLATSFATTTSAPGERRVARLEIRESPQWRSRIAAWVHPRAPDMERISRSLDRALAGAFQLVGAAPIENPVLADQLLELYDFDDRASLDADVIASVNQALGTDAFFIARLDRAPLAADDGPTSGACADTGRFEIDVRMLAGSHPDVVSIHANRECIADGMRAFGVWNERAPSVYLAAFILLFFPLLRGWGKIEVRIKVPPKTKGFFAIRVSTKENDLPTERKKSRGSGRLKRSLRSLSRYERHMADRVTLFRWIPARKRSYYVTVKGPLMDATGEEIIGHFLEAQEIRVNRGKVERLEYDFQPTECGVEVQVRIEGAPVKGARVALRGVVNSVRYARDGTAIIPLGKGTHGLIVGGADRVGEFPLHIETLGRSVFVLAELSDENALIFKGCTAAVEPYLAGDFGTAAEILSASGLDHEAHLVRAALHTQLGATDRAADELEAAGQFGGAALLRATGDDLAGSAKLFERAGEHDRAAEAYQASGELADAARCYEAAYDYENAVDCYREIGDDAKVLEILEKTGEFFDAGRLAAEQGDANRALMDLQQVETRDPNYGEACKRIADVLEERGDFDIAADKIQEALRCVGSGAPAALHERHADLLVKAGRPAQAIDAYQTVRRIEPRRRDLGERIAELERENGSESVTEPTDDSRYEILGELGRGAMGVVFKARDKHLGRIVALKRLPDNLRDHPAAVKLFRREAQAAAALNHRNIVTLFDAGEENGFYFITMEMLEGMPLNRILKKRTRLGVADTARLGVQIAAGLQYAHEQRIVHRDIKAGNLFFTCDKTVKIMDFGLAKTIEEVRKTSTMIGGTPYYMAPEQAGGEELDHRADLYAFGVTLYQLVTGRVPFRDGDLAYHHRHTEPPDPRTHVPDIPAALAELILEMLAKAPADRPADAAEVGRRLQALQIDLGGEP